MKLSVLRLKIIDIDVLLKKVIEIFEISLSKSYAYKLLKSIGPSHKSYKKTIASLNKAQKNFIKDVNNLGYESLISIDETSIYLHFCNNYVWSLKGKDCTIYDKYINKTIKYSPIVAISNKKILKYEIYEGGFLINKLM
jgi:hypothetical protein